MKHFYDENMVKKANLLIVTLAAGREKLFTMIGIVSFLWISTSISCILKPMRLVMEERKETHNPDTSRC